MDAKKIEEVPFEEVYEVEKYNGLQRKSVRR